MYGGMANEGVLDTLEKAVRSQGARMLDLRRGAAKDAMGSALLETDVGEVCVGPGCSRLACPGQNCQKVYAGG